MAEVFRPRYTEPFPPGVKILKRGKRSGKPVARIAWPGGRREVVRTNAAGTRVLRFSRTWWVRFWLPNGKREKAKGYRDRKATEALAVDLERKAARAAEGIFDPTDG